MNKFKFWLNNARTVALPQSVMPAIMALCIIGSQSSWGGFWQFGQGYFSLPLAIIALIGIVCAHLSVNLFDDYFDYKNAGIESREKLNRAGMRARIGKALYLAEGKATLADTRRVASLFGLVAIVAGGAILYFRGLPIIILAACGGFLGFFYSAKPFMFCYRGMGELVTGIIFGPLLMLGMGQAAAGIFDPGLGLISVAVGLLVINILYTHSIMDAAPDESVGKKTLATILHTPVKMLAGSFVFNFFPYAFVVLAVVLGWVSPWVLVSFVTLPMAVSLFKLMIDYCEENAKGLPPAQTKIKWWMGPMSNWDGIVAAGIDWFMIRWFLARNMLTYLVLLISIGAFIN